MRERVVQPVELLLHAVAILPQVFQPAPAGGQELLKLRDGHGVDDTLTWHGGFLPSSG
jgi:hypothetical protein